jgi:hypothetical protein
MKLELNLEELDLLVDALDQRQNELKSAAEALPELEAVNTLYKRL